MTVEMLETSRVWRFMMIWNRAKPRPASRAAATTDHGQRAGAREGRSEDEREPDE